MTCGMPQTFTVRAIPSKASNIPKYFPHRQKDQLADQPWAVHGYTYNILVRGLYPGTPPEWEYGIHTSNFDPVVVPITLTNNFLKHVRELFDEAAAEGKAVTSLYL